MTGTRFVSSAAASRTAVRALFASSAFRFLRNAEDAKKTLTAVREAAALETNLVPVILEAVKARATLGEIAGAMREIFGAYRARSEI